MRIPAPIIAQIQQAADIVEVVGDFVSLKKKGKDYKACCPFHDEKTPSFSVSAARNIFKCFGCGKGGDAITFVMEIENVSYVEALRYLAKKYSIEIPEEAFAPPTDEEQAAQSEKESLLIALNYAKNYFQEQLYQHEEGRLALNYLKERGFSESTQKSFDLGYSRESWDAFYKQALRQGFKVEILEKAGLVNRKENSEQVTDRFRERIMFPIHNISGQVIAFGARTLRKDKNIAKYVNSPETPVYHKSQVLYGLYQAKKAIRQEECCYLVEGYADVIALFQAGIENVVASSGTSLTVEQVRLIRRFSNRIVMLYDGDAAGLNAALRGVDLILAEGLQVSVVVFPEGEDPDSYVRRVGTNAFKEYVQENTQDFISFKAGLLMKDVGKDPFKKAEALKEVLESIARVGDTLQRAILCQRAAAIFQIEEQSLLSEVGKILRKQQKEQERPAVGIENAELAKALEQETAPERKTLSPSELAYYQEQENIRLLLQYADLPIEGEGLYCEYLLAETEDIAFQTPVFQEILQQFRNALRQGQILKADFFVQQYDNEAIRNTVIDLIAEKHELSEGWQKNQIYVPQKDEAIQQVTYSHLLRLKFRFVQKMIDDNKKKLQSADSEEIDKYLLIHQNLKNKEKELAQALGNVIR
jgi:DNA primase